MVALTAAGAAFVDQARATLDQYDRSIEAARNVAGRSEQSLSIGFECCAPYHGFAAVVEHFLSRNSGIRLSSFQMNAAEQREALLRHRIDTGFGHPPLLDDGVLSLRNTRATEAGASAVPDADRGPHRPQPAFEEITFEKVEDEPFVLAMPETHRLAMKKRVPCSELAQEKYTLYRALAPACFDAVQRICKSAGFTPDVAHESNEISVALSLIPSARVVTLLPETVGGWDAPRVVFRALEGEVASVPCGFSFEARQTISRHGSLH